MKNPPERGGRSKNVCKRRKKKKGGKRPYPFPTLGGRTATGTSLRVLYQEKSQHKKKGREKTTTTSEYLK